MEHLASQELASVSRGHREERSGVHGTRRGLNDSAVEPRNHHETITKPSRTIVHTRARAIAYLLNLAATRAQRQGPWFVSASYDPLDPFSKKKKYAR